MEAPGKCILLAQLLLFLNGLSASSLGCPEMNSAYLLPLEKPCQVYGREKSFLCVQPLPRSRTRQVGKVISKFVVLDDLSRGKTELNYTACIGLESIVKADILNPGNGEYTQETILFDSNQTVGVIRIDKKCWGRSNRTCPHIVLLRADILELPPIAASAERAAFWDFSSKILSEQVAWAWELRVEGAGLRDQTLVDTISWLPGLSGSGLGTVILTGEEGCRESDAETPTVPPLGALPKLRKFSMRYCRLKALGPETLNGSETVEELHLDGNYFPEVPDGILHLTNLKSLSINSNCVPFTFNPQFMSDMLYLEVLNLSGTRIESWKTKLPRHRRLKALYMAKSELYSLENITFNFPALEHLDLRLNHISFIPEQAFKNLCRLKYLDLRLNNVTSWPAFPPTKISYVDLSFNRLDALKNLWTRGFSLKYLNLAGNHISQWDDVEIFLGGSCQQEMGCKDGIPLGWGRVPSNEDSTGSKGGLQRTDRALQTAWLKSLDLSSNRIKEFSPVMLSSLDALEEVNVGGNPIDCGSCSVEALQDWLRKAPAVREHAETVRCAQPSGMAMWPVESAPLPDDFACDPSLEEQRLRLVVGVPLGAIVFVALILVIAAAVFRVEAMYVAHLLRVRAAGEDGSRKIIFDAFVVYSGEDRRFVLKKLVPLLRRREKYQLCLLDLGFRMAPHIVNNILENISKSRRVILVLSQTFIANDWNAWELEMVHRKRFHDDRSFLMLLEKDPLERDHLPRELLFLLDTRLLVQWPRPETPAAEEEVLWQFRLTLGRSLSSVPDSGSSNSNSDSPAPTPPPTPNERTPLLSNEVNA